jgi:hypothetical protein
MQRRWFVARRGRGLVGAGVELVGVEALTVDGQVFAIQSGGEMLLQGGGVGRGAPISGRSIGRRGMPGGSCGRRVSSSSSLSRVAR